jgi:hypothetical protein
VPEFLKKITIKHKLVRETIREKENGFSYTRKEWKPKETEPTEVYVLGERTLQNGRREWHMEYIAFYPDEYIKALLVIKDEKTNPFYILAETKE